MSMKNIKWLLGAFSMLLAMTTFTACSDDDDKLEVPVFPDLPQQVFFGCFILHPFSLPL